MRGGSCVSAFTTLHFILNLLFSLVEYSVLAGTLLGVWAIVVAIVDVVRGQRRDWLHWLGIVTVVALMVFTQAWSVAIRLTQR
jgi:hypothetical protein